MNSFIVCIATSLLYRSSSMTTANNSPRSSASVKGRRSLRGCLTCRVRHVRCSLEQPACSNCLSLSITCDGYRPQFKWLVYGSRDGKNVVILHKNERSVSKNASRREIFSLSERRCMSQNLVNSLGQDSYRDANQCVDIALKNLERHSFIDVSPRSDHTGDSSAGQFSGPFGVLLLKTLRSTETAFAS
ncbi:hypothetical protein V8C42DRAFT_319730 [Trichoderma barbatum]